MTETNNHLKSENDNNQLVDAIIILLPIFGTLIAIGLLFYSGISSSEIGRIFMGRFSAYLSRTSHDLFL
jgi:hypothetical protein